jgi:hypothetical protein
MARAGAQELVNAAGGADACVAMMHQGQQLAAAAGGADNVRGFLQYPCKVLAALCRVINLL